MTVQPHRPTLSEHWFALPAILLFGLSLRLFFFVGVGGWDDISYLAHVHEIGDGVFDTVAAENGTFPFRYRVGLIIPTAVLFKIFGASEAVAAIVPMACSLGLIYVCWRLGRLISPVTGAIAGLLMATLPSGIVSAGSLLPIPCGAFFAGLSVVLWIEAEGLIKPQDTPPGHLRYFLLGLSLGCAYLFRLEAGLYGIVFIALAILYRRPHVGWLFAAVGVVTVLGAENYVYWARHGEWLYRLKVVSAGFSSMTSDLSEELVARKSVWMFAKAVFLKPSELGIHGAAAFVAAAVSLRWCRQEHRAVLLWFWTLVGYLCFGSWSFTSYVPTTKEPRYLMLVAVPGLVLLANLLARQIQHTGRRRGVGYAGLTTIVAAGLFLTNIVWVYHHENAAGSRQLAESVRSYAREHGLQPERTTVWAEHYVAANLVALMPEFDVRALTDAEKNSGYYKTRISEDQIDGGLVVNDSFLNRKYAEATAVMLPEYLQSPPENWSLICEDQTKRDGFKYAVVRWFANVSGHGIGGLDKSLETGRLVVYAAGSPNKSPSSQVLSLSD